MVKKRERASLFIYLTYKCSGNCNFCFIDPRLRNNSSNLSLNEIEDNIKFFSDKYLLREIALTGGEPLLHKDIIKLLKLLGDKSKYPRLNFLIMASDIAKCSSSKFSSEIINVLRSNQNIYSCFHVSLNNFYPDNISFKKRKKAIINLSKKNINLSFIIVFIKNNNNFKKNLIFLKNIFRDYYFKNRKANFILELRLPFNPQDHSNNNSFILNSDNFIKKLKYTCNFLSKESIPFTLRNIPLCYSGIKNNDILSKLYKKSSISKKIIRIDKYYQLDKAIIKNYNDNLWSTQKKCFNCKLKNKCNGIDMTYIKEFNYPKLKIYE